MGAVDLALKNDSAIAKQLNNSLGAKSGNVLNITKAEPSTAATWPMWVAVAVLGVGLLFLIQKTNKGGG